MCSAVSKLWDQKKIWAKERPGTWACMCLFSKLFYYYLLALRTCGFKEKMMKPYEGIPRANLAKSYLCCKMKYKKLTAFIYCSLEGYEGSPWCPDVHFKCNTLRIHLLAFGWNIVSSYLARQTFVNVSSIDWAVKTWVWMWFITSQYWVGVCCYSKN